MILMNHGVSLDTSVPIISHSLIYYLQDVQKQIQHLFENEANHNHNHDEPIYTLEQLIKMVNPYEFIFSKLPNSKLSVSKLKPCSPLFYDLLEIIITLNLFDILEATNTIQTLHVGKHGASSVECINLLREFQDDRHVSFASFADLDESPSKCDLHHALDFMYFDLENQDRGYKQETLYIGWFMHLVVVLLQYQKTNGIAIFKVDDLFIKPVLDFLFIVCHMYDKVYIIKPNSSNIVSSEKFIVCKKFFWTHDHNHNHDQMMQYFQERRHERKDGFLAHELPYFFINKIEEFNMITGQQQLNAFNQIIHLIKTKNKEDKLENFKKANVQKCISWCEKYKIPNNKFNEKNNIFLPLLKIEKEEVVPLDEPETF